MKVILINDFNKLGKLGEQVKVKPGYARNFLIPNNKAIIASKENIKYFKSYKLKLEKKINDLEKMYKNMELKINSLKEITIKVKSVSKLGRIFGSIGPKEIVHCMLLKGIKISKNKIHLNRKFIKNIGKYKIKIHIYKNIFSYLNLNVIS